MEDVAPTPEQLEEMRELVREGMEDGAVGVSTSLIYPPAVYASTEELIALTSVAGEYGGVYFTHMRNESHAVLEAIREAITIGEGAGVPVHIYHLKAAGQRNWPLMDAALALIDSVRTAGMDVTADIYPYVRNGIGLGSFLHPRHYARGTQAFLETLSDPELRAQLRNEVETDSEWENWYQHVGMDWNNVLIVAASDEVDPDVINRSVAEAAEVLGTDPWNAFFDLVQAGGVSVNPLSMNEEQKWAAFRAPFVMIDTDASPVNPGVNRQLASARLRGLPARHRQVRARGRRDHPRGGRAAHDFAGRPPARPVRPGHRGARHGGRPGGLRPGRVPRHGRVRLERDALRGGGGLPVRERYAGYRRR